MRKKFISAYFAVNGNISRKLYLFMSLVPFILLLFLWQLMLDSHYVRSIFLPYPYSLYSTLIKWKEGNLYDDIFISTYQVFMGFIVAFMIAVPLGILAGSLKIFEALIQPLSDFGRYLPAAAFIPLVIVWFGLGEEPKIAIIFIGVFFQLIVMTIDAVRSTKKDIVEAALTLGAHHSEIIGRIILPISAPKIMNAMRICFGWGWTYVVVAELVASTRGLGYAIMQAQRFMNTPKIFVGIIVIGILGLFFDASFRIAHKFLFSWDQR